EIFIHYNIIIEMTDIGDKFYMLKIKQLVFWVHNSSIMSSYMGILTPSLNCNSRRSFYGISKISKRNSGKQKGKLIQLKRDYKNNTLQKRPQTNVSFKMKDIDMIG